MTRRIAMILVPALMVTLSACSGGRPKERINPPDISIQELRIEGDTCTLLLRVQNHSTVTMHYARLQFDRLTIDGRELAPLTATPNFAVTPYTGEPFAQTVPCPALSEQASELVYRLEGRIEATEPRSREFRFEYRSRLLPVPGLTGVYR